MRKIMVMTMVTVVVLFGFGVGNCYANNLMAMRWFSQLDTWKSDQMGTSGNTIGSHGCTINCVTMAMNYFGISTDPRQFNQWLSENGGYDEGGYLNWPKISVYTGGVVYHDDSWPRIVDNDRLNQELDSGYPVVLQVVLYLSNGEPVIHFILAVGRIGSTYYVVDPRDYPARLTTLAESYGSYAGMRLLRGPTQTNVTGYRNGWDSIVSPLFVDCYGYHGGRPAFGLPVARTIYNQSRPDTVWEWELCYAQVFDGGDLNECAIVYDRWVNCGKAFPIHGQLWAYYKAHDGPNLLIDGLRLGGPIDQEKYATDDYNGHQLAVQEMANGFLVYDTVTGFSDARSKEATGFSIATIQGDPSTLTILAYASSPTSAYITCNDVNAATYAVYQDGTYIGNLSGFELTVSGLLPSTTYVFQIKALDGSGNVMSESAEQSVTTKALEVASPLNLTLRSSQFEIEASWAPVSADRYYLYLNGSLVTTTTSLSHVFTGITSGVTYTVTVEAKDVLGNILQTASKSVTTGQFILLTIFFISANIKV